MSANYWAPADQHARFADLCGRFLNAKTDPERAAIIREVYGDRPQTTSGQIFTYEPCPECGGAGQCLSVDRTLRTAHFKCKDCGQLYSTVTDPEGNLASVSAGGPQTQAGQP